MAFSLLKQDGDKLFLQDGLGYLILQETARVEALEGAAQ